MKNMKVSMKLTVSFVVLIILTVVIGVIGILGLRDMNDAQNDMYENHIHAIEAMGNLRELFANERNTMRTIMLHQDDAQRVQQEMAKFADYNKQAEESFALYDITINENDDNSLYLLAKKTWFSDYAKLKEDCFVMIREGRFNEAYNHYTTIGAPIISPIADGLGKTTELNNEWASEANDEGHELYTSRTAILTGAMLLVLAVSVFFIFYISSLIAKPLAKLVNVADNVANGNLNINVDTSAKDETGDLARAFNKVVVTINTITQDLTEVSHAFKDMGDIDARVDSSKYKGSYNGMIEGINSLLDNQVSDTLLVLNSLTEIGNGNFNLTIKQLPGKKAVLNQQFDSLTSSLKNVYGDLSHLVNSAAKGDLKVRADAAKYKGDWERIVSALNRLIQEVEEPIAETVEVLGYVSKGNFDNFAKGDYQGEFLKIKNSINDTVTNVASYIEEISRVLAALANDDLDQSITREYVGKFSDIKEAINNIITKFNRVIIDIFQAADQVAAGSKQISESSMTLAQGATEQASAIQELNATITTINENTISNADSAKEAEHLSNDSKLGAASGSENMRRMLESMDAIKDSSSKISKIIKVIDDIAFQTNLLALNAAVEAARAGEHGKGFAVVAEEVRNLAGRSQGAAKETAELIEESITKVNEGTKIADQTSDALQDIVAGVDKVAAIITAIAESSAEQTDAIGQVVMGVQQITEVIQNNSATSEESASASEELASQADVLKSLVDVFNTKSM